MRLDVDVIAALLDADLDVLEEPLRPIRAAATHPFTRHDADLAGIADVHVGLARHVAHAQPGRPLDDEGLLHGLIECFPVVPVIVHADERGAHGAGDLLRVDAEVETPVTEPDVRAARVPRATLLPPA